MDNPEVIRIYIKHAFKEGVVIRLKDLPNKPTDVFNSSKNRKQVASVAQKVTHNPFKNKDTHHKEIEK